MFPIVAKKYNFVVGVDTHAKTHAAVVINQLGEVIASREFRVTNADIDRFITWTEKITTNNLVLFAVEGTSSYGETLTRELLTRCIPVVEVKPPKAKHRGGSGKTDRLDAELAALSVLRVPIDKLIIPRTGTTRKILRALVSTRRNIIKMQVMNKNALTALIRSIDLGVDARAPLTPLHYQSISRWHLKPQDELYLIKQEAKRLANAVKDLSTLLEQNLTEIRRIVGHLTPELLEEPGIGPISLAQIICSYSHKGRIHSATAFATLAGTTPIPVSSGNTAHHRLNHYGDRQLNSAIHTIVLTRMRTDQATKDYVEKRISEGCSKRDIRRALKRYVARSIFKRLEEYDILI